MNALPIRWSSGPIDVLLEGGSVSGEAAGLKTRQAKVGIFADAAGAYCFGIAVELAIMLPLYRHCSARIGSWTGVRLED